MPDTRRRHPEVPVLEVDILTPDGDGLPVIDYANMNGLLTDRGDHDIGAVLHEMHALLRTEFQHARRRSAFSTTSPEIEARRDDRLRIPIDTVAAFAARELSRRQVVRHDYGPYEYTTSVYREPAFESVRWMRRLAGSSVPAGAGRSWPTDENEGLQKGRRR